MTAPLRNKTQYRFLRIDASTICQLKCPACPTAFGNIDQILGSGFLKFTDFKKIVDENPQVSHIELSNWGEILLNKELSAILKYAYKCNVALSAGNGMNLNTVGNEVLEAMVKYKLRYATCSIDGASQETYSKYRVNGNFSQVIANVKKIIALKEIYRSPFPKLRWQFVAFGTNAHEIQKARQMARALDMDFFLKLSWGDLYGANFSPVKDGDHIRKETGLGVATRREYLKNFGEDYAERNFCLGLWHHPQINYDGRILGCSINFWSDFGNAFQKDLRTELNNEKMTDARNMLMGKTEAKPEIPCSTCKVYQRIKERNNWVEKDEVKPKPIRSRNYIMVENKFLGVEGTRQLDNILQKIEKAYHCFKKMLPREKIRQILLWAPKSLIKKGGTRLPSRIYSLDTLRVPYHGYGWIPHHLFKVSTTGMDFFSCHVSTLISAHIPHPPHDHKEEEILFLLDGEVDLILPHVRVKSRGHRVNLKPGQFAYYPAFFPHSLQTKSRKPASYLMFKWNGKKNPFKEKLKFSTFDAFAHLDAHQAQKGFTPHCMFEGPSDYLKKLHCHSSTMTSGAGYVDHCDSHDVAILVIEGAVETLHQRVGANNVIFYPAGEPHGMSNPGSKTAKYIVFEFHGPGTGLLRNKW